VSLAAPVQPAPATSAPTADLGGILAQLDPTALRRSADYRRAVSRCEPLIFNLLYLPHHLKGPETGDRISFSQFHLDMYAEAKTWLRSSTRPAEHRTAYVAPRGAGKSTTGFLGLPLWAAAHLHVDFIAAFAHAGDQAEKHLMTFKNELDRNELLRYDYPELCTPMKRPGGVQVSDNRSMLLASNGFVFVAKGIDSSSLGMKIGERRPRLLLMDDVEPDESSYSLYQKDKRLMTIRDAVFPLNIYARVLMLGTTTMYGSVMHDIVRQSTDPGNCPDWVHEENIQTKYYPAIVTNDQGQEESLWPEKWPLDYLQSIRHTRSYQKNMLNQPVAGDGGFWSPSDFRYDPPSAITRRIISVDPAVTTRTTSDFTGLAVVGYDPIAQRCVVEHASQVKMSGAMLRAHLLKLIERNPGVRAVLIEDNQGKDLWGEILSPLPVKIVSIHQTINKSVRASKVLDYYQNGWVAHSESLPAFEEQACAFPECGQ
jgi:hypothetical protein